MSLLPRSLSSRVSSPFAVSPRMVCTGVVLAALLSAAVLAHAAPSEAELNAGVQLIQRGSDGDSSAVDAAAEHFARLSAADPADPALRAYAGAAHTLKATTTFLPWRKLSFAEDGLAQLDKALSLLTPAHDAVLHRQVPVSLETRFTAANTFLSLPSMFNRHARGAKLLDEVLKSPLFDATPAPFRAAVWLRAAKDARGDKRAADEKRLLQQVVQSGAPQTAAAQALLKDLP